MKGGCAMSIDMTMGEFASSLQKFGISRKEIDFVMCVLQHIIKDPFEESMKICKALKLKKEQLKYYYSIIQQSSIAQEILQKNFPRHYSLFRDRFLFTDFWKKVFGGKNPFPIEVEIHPSEICNLKCQFCPTLGNDYKNQEYYPRLKDKMKNREFVVNKIQSIFKDLAEGGTKKIIFSGGKEPTLSPLILELISAAKKAKLAVKVVTNGSGFMIPYKIGEVKISGDELFEFYSSNVDRIHISLNAHNRELFNKVKGLKPNSQTFDLIISNLKKIISFRNKLKKRKKPAVEIYVAVLVDKENYLQLPEIIKFLADLDVDIISINRYQYQMVGKEDVFSDKELEELLRNLKKMMGVYKSKKTKLIVSVDDFKNDYYKLILRRKARCWTAFWETAFNPVFLGVACDTAAFPNRERFDGADFKLGSVFECPDFKSYWNHNYEIRKNICSDKCSDCRLCHKLTNVYAEKLYIDYQNGFELKDQPFYSFIQT